LHRLIDEPQDISLEALQQSQLDHRVRLASQREAFTAPKTSLDVAFLQNPVAPK
jgi:hypothetical protein